MGKTSDEQEGREEDVFVKQKLQHTATRLQMNEKSGLSLLFSHYPIL